MAEDSLKTLEVPTPDPLAPSRVFLEATLKNEGGFPMMPHSMYCLPLWPGITLVLLTKVTVFLNFVDSLNQRTRNLVFDYKLYIFFNKLSNAFGPCCVYKN